MSGDRTAITEKTSVFLERVRRSRLHPRAIDFRELVVSLDDGDVSKTRDRAVTAVILADPTATPSPPRVAHGRDRLV